MPWNYPIIRRFFHIIYVVIIHLEVGREVRQAVIEIVPQLIQARYKNKICTKIKTRKEKLS